MQKSLLKIFGYCIMFSFTVTLVLISHPSYSKLMLLDFLFLYPFRFTFIPCAYPTIAFIFYCSFENLLNRGKFLDFITIFLKREKFHSLIILQCFLASIFYCLTKKLPKELDKIDNTYTTFLFINETITGILTYLDSAFLMTSFGISITLIIKIMNELYFNRNYKKCSISSNCSLD